MISLHPISLKVFASCTISSKFLENSAPRVNGTTQKLQNLSHPSCIVIKEDILAFFL